MATGYCGISHMHAFPTIHLHIYSLSPGYILVLSKAVHIMLANFEYNKEKLSIMIFAGMIWNITAL